MLKDEHNFLFRLHCEKSICEAPSSQRNLLISVSLELVLQASVHTPGSGYVLLHHVMGETNGDRGIWSYVSHLPCSLRCLCFLFFSFFIFYFNKTQMLMLNEV